LIKYEEPFRLRGWRFESGVPVLIVSGSEDHVVDQSLWQDDAALGQPHVLKRTMGFSASSGPSFWITRHTVEEETPKSGPSWRMVRFVR
jgi:hypothetical protein